MGFKPKTLRSKLKVPGNPTTRPTLGVSKGFIFVFSVPKQLVNLLHYPVSSVSDTLSLLNLPIFLIFY
jgi:hypothetical protein